MPLDDLAYRAASAFKARLLDACPEQVIEVRVYGSRARGDAREDSDLDILVLTRDDETRVRRAASEAVQAVYRLLDYPFPISPQVMSQGHFGELLRRERLYARVILEEGVPV